MAESGERMGQVSRMTARWGRTLQVWRFYRVSRLLFVTIWLLTRERRRVVRARARGQDAHPNLDVLRRALRTFRVTAIEMGGLLIHGRHNICAASFVLSCGIMRILRVIC